MGDRSGLAYSVEGVALVLSDLGDSVTAMQLLSASNRLRQEIDASLPAANRKAFEKIIADLRAQVGETQFERA